MSLARTLLLKASDNRWLREHGVKAPFVRRAVSAFMPGETADDMLTAAVQQAALGVGAVFTRLGENVADMAEANGVTAHSLTMESSACERWWSWRSSTRKFEEDAMTSIASWDGSIFLNSFFFSMLQRFESPFFSSVLSTIV